MVLFFLQVEFELLHQVGTKCKRRGRCSTSWGFHLSQHAQYLVLGSLVFVLFAIIRLREVPRCAGLSCNFARQAQLEVKLRRRWRRLPSNSTVPVTVTVDLRFPTPHSTLYTPNSSTPHSTLYTLHYTLYITLHSTLKTQDSTFYTVHYTLHTLHFALHIPHFTFHALRSTHYHLHSTLCTPLTLLHTLHSTLHTDSTLYTPHSTTPTPHFTLYTPHFALHTLHHSTLHTQDSRLYILHRTLHTPHSTLCTSHPPLHIPRFTLHPLPFTLHTLHSPHPTPHPTLHAPHWLHTLHSTLHNSDSTLHTLHSTLCTPHFHSLLHTTCHTLHFTPCTLHFTLHTLHSPHSRLDSLQWYGNRARSFKTVVMSCLTKVFYVMFIRVGGLNQVDTFCIFLHFEWFLLMGSYFMVYSPCRASFALAAWAFSMKNARITSFTSSAVMKKGLSCWAKNHQTKKIRKSENHCVTWPQWNSSST